ncbi:hypothetical protein BKA01_003210 [Pseudonocardia eucalypti]|nr:hypothetical protein [Pseudonocardia eucalypti]
MEIDESWDDEVRKGWLGTQQGIRMSLIHEHGNADHERKIEDFQAIGPAPWTIIDKHNVFLKQARSAFTHGAYYPALVAACALGERLLNELVIRLRDDYVGHPATASVATQTTITDWVKCIAALVDWGVLDDDTATVLNELRKLRNKSIHYGEHLSGATIRDDALSAVRSIQSVIETVFAPHGAPPRFISGTEGHSFLSLASEQEPFFKRFYLPACVLVSSNFEMRPTPEDSMAVFDDKTYQDEYPSLTDEEFA